MSSVVDAVKKDGPKKSGLADGIDVLVARCGAKDEADAVAACSAVKALATECPSSLAFVKECLGACKLCLFTVLSRCGLYFVCDA